MSTPEPQPDRAAAEKAQGGDYDLTLFGDAHVKAYEESNGEVGFIWNGAPIAILTTTGAKSGKERRHALIFGRHGDDIVFIASQGGAPDNPNWYKNLDANPAVHVQVRGDRFAGTARTATHEERAEIWPAMNVIWPAYDDYQGNTDRVIPVVLVSRN